MTTMPVLSLAELNAVCRQDLYTFAQRVLAQLNNSPEFDENWHIEMLASHLTDVAEGKNRHLIINAPPRGFKSVLTSVAYVAWMLGRDPTLKFLVVSYGADLAEKLARDCKQVMVSDWYQAMFPNTRISAKRSAAHDFETEAGGGRAGLSMSGAITGRGADCIIIDDPIKPDDVRSRLIREQVNASLGKTLLSRLNSKRKGSVILVAQRVHVEDLTAKLMTSGRFKLICLPAIALKDETWRYSTIFGDRVIQRAKGEALHPTREPLETLEEVRGMMGGYDFSAQYQQMPLPEDGAFVNLDNCARYDRPPEKFDRTIQSWDTAAKAHELADYSVCTTWGQLGKTFYLLAVHRKKLEYPQLRSFIYTLWDLERPNHIVIEDTSAGQALIQEMKALGVPGVVAFTPRKDKEMRLMSVSALFESGRVLLPVSAPWLEAFLYEMNTFPHGAHDDQVDSVSQALSYLSQLRNAQGWYDYGMEVWEKSRRERGEVFGDAAPA